MNMAHVRETKGVILLPFAVHKPLTYISLRCSLNHLYSSALFTKPLVFLCAVHKTTCIPLCCSLNRLYPSALFTKPLVSLCTVYKTTCIPLCCSQNHLSPSVLPWCRFFLSLQRTECTVLCGRVVAFNPPAVRPIE